MNAFHVGIGKAFSGDIAERTFDMRKNDLIERASKMHVLIASKECDVGFCICTIDNDAIHDYLCNRSYWGQGRSIETVRKCIKNSLCFGVYYENDTLVGFARVVTDYTVFAYLMDLFILEPHRKIGLGKKLVDHIVNNFSFKDIRFWRLDTMDKFLSTPFLERIMR